MDLNALYSNHQLLLMRADASTCRERRDGHLDRADVLAGQIATIQNKSGAGASRGWTRTKAQRGELPALSSCRCAA